ncbi:MAG: hypothetical protein HYX76_07085 [Acidobacteria bacterium]|nr:hypothetical protein [Acidobacteriota bacterium]
MTRAILASVGVLCASAFQPAANQPSSNESDPIVYLVAGGSVYHRKDCISVAGKVLIERRLSELGPGYQPDSTCKAPRRSTASPRPITSTTEPSDPEVYLLAGGTVYHQRNCAELQGKVSIPRQLSELGPGYEPHSGCQAPKRAVRPSPAPVSTFSNSGSGGAGRTLPQVSYQSSDGTLTVTVESRVTEANDVWWKYSWKVTIRNSGKRPQIVSGRIEFQDADGFVIETATVPATRIDAAAEDTVTGFELITTASAVNVAQLAGRIGQPKE